MHNVLYFLLINLYIFIQKKCLISKIKKDRVGNSLDLFLYENKPEKVKKKNNGRNN